MTRLPPIEAKAILAGILADFAENDLDNLGGYLKHCGFDIGPIQNRAICSMHGLAITVSAKADMTPIGLYWTSQLCCQSRGVFSSCCKKSRV